MALHLVTGGAGFIGSHLVAALVASGAPIELLRGDITDPEACLEAARGCDGVFHEAAQVSVPRSIEDPERSYEVNVMGTLRVLEAARAAGVGRAVFAASSAAYGDSEVLPKVEDFPVNPLSPYASGKIAGEHLMAVWGRCYGMRTVCLRYFNVFGPRQVDDSPYTGVIALFARALLEGRAPTIFGDGEQSRDLTYVDNVVEANLAAMEADVPPGTVVNVGGGERITINELYRAMAEGLGSSLEAVHGPGRPGDVRHSLASVERARELLGWSPRVGWREGLERTLAWYRSRAEARG